METGWGGETVEVAMKGEQAGGSIAGRWDFRARGKGIVGLSCQQLLGREITDLVRVAKISIQFKSLGLCGTSIWRAGTQHLQHGGKNSRACGLMAPEDHRHRKGPSPNFIPG